MATTPAPSPASPPGTNIEWSIELLRGIAALLVLYAHYRLFGSAPRSLLDFAFSGVDLFFAISGFVFAPYFFGKRLDIAPFFVRRLFRIYPLYVVALGTYTALHYANNQSTDHFFKHLFFLHTLETREIAFYYNPAFWSLPPEMEFYIAMPVLCMTFQGTPRVTLLLAMACLTHIGLVTQLGAGGASARIAEIGLFHLPGVLAEFLFGALSWRIASTQPPTALRIFLIALGCSLWTVMALIFMRGGDAAIESSWWLKGNAGLLSALAYALALAGFIGWQRSAPLRIQKLSLALGNLSFGIYLFHNALPTMLGPIFARPTGALFAITCTAGTLIIAYLAHRFCEEPLRQWGRMWASSLRTRLSMNNR